MSLMEGIQPNGLPEAVSLDGYGNLLVAISGEISTSVSGGATEAKQDDEIDLLTTIDSKLETSNIFLDSIDTKEDGQTALLEAISESTQLGRGWFPKRTDPVIQFADMTVSGINLTPLIQPGKKVIGIMGSRTTLNGQVIYLEAIDNDPGSFVDLDFGRGYIHYGEWKTIGPLTTAGCFPLRLLTV